MVKKKNPQKTKVKKKAAPPQEKEKTSKVEVLPPLTGQDNLSDVLDLIPMDSTSVIEISLMQNQNYAPEILQRIKSSQHMTDLLAIKERGDVDTVLHVGKVYIIEICRDIDSLKTHTSMFVVLAMIKVGMILNEISIALGNDRSKYSIWVRENFGSQHTRYFQQSRQLLSMGETAIRHSALGKNRLLQVDRLQSKEQYKEIIEQHPYPDITQDRQGIVFSEHTDAAVTLYNLQQGGIDFADFDQAYLLSCFNKHWIEQKTVKKIKDWLDKFSTPERKKEVFEDYVMNKMIFPSESEYQVVGNLQSLTTILSNLILFYENHIQTGQTEWVSSVNRSTFERAKEIMRTLTQITIPERIATAIEEAPPVAVPALEKKKQSVKRKKKGVKK
jgi:hypothetical protein